MREGPTFGTGPGPISPHTDPLPYYAAMWTPFEIVVARACSFYVTIDLYGTHLPLETPGIPFALLRSTVGPFQGTRLLQANIPSSHKFTG